MRKIGFFGGCFNPPNNLHIEIANNLILERKLDKVFFVPVNDFYKKDGLINAEHRLNMLKIATKGYKNIEVDDIELKEKRQLYAIDAFKLVKESKFIKEDDEVYFIMGSDNYSKMHNWKNYDLLMDNYKYIIVERNKTDITSTKIREMIKENNCEVKKYLNDEVYEYIIEKDLYKL